MHSFDYLSIFVSIIIALGVSHLLSSAAGLILLRDRVRLHGPTLVWMEVLFLVQVLIWWGSFNRRDVDDWTFFGFLFYLLMPIIASMLGFILLPSPQPDTDLEREYCRNRRWFFGLFVAIQAVSLIEDSFRSRVGFDLNLGLRVAILAMLGAGLAIGSRRAQLPIAIAVLLLALGHIAFGFWRL